MLFLTPAPRKTDSYIAESAPGLGDKFELTVSYTSEKWTSDGTKRIDLHLQPVTVEASGTEGVTFRSYKFGRTDGRMSFWLKLATLARKDAKKTRQLAAALDPAVPAIFAAAEAGDQPLALSLIEGALAPLRAAA